MNLLLVHEQPEVREILRFGIETRFTIKIYEAANAEEAQKLLEQFRANKSAIEILKKAGSGGEAVKMLIDKTDFDLLLCEFGPSSAQLLEFLKSNSLPTLFVLWNLGKSNIQKGLESRIHRVLSGKDILPDVIKLLDDLHADDRFKENPKREATLDDLYCPIKTPLLIRVSPLKSDIYIRLSEKKYVRLFPEGGTFDVNDLKKYYKEKKVEYLYLHRDECNEFLDKFKTDLNDLIASETVDIEEANQAIQGAHETMQNLLARTGFTEDVQEIARQSVKLAMKVMGESPELITILNRLKENREKYITTHSMLLAHVACAMSASMSWNSSATYEKLTMAALMHAVTMKSQAIAEVDSLDELEAKKSAFMEEDLKSYRTHPIDASMLVRKMNKIPADVDAIIAQHHEKADGAGFPRGVTHSHIGHLSCLFIIAHDMTRFLLAKEESLGKGSKLDMGEFLAERKGVYAKGNFRKIFEVLEREFAAQEAAAKTS